MDLSENGERLKMVYLQILEVAKGNLWHRIERSKKKDEMEALVAVVNMMTEEIKESRQHEGYINFHGSYMYTVQAIFILDKDYLIAKTNAGTREFLGHGDSEMLDKPFEGLLAARSKKKWNRISKNILLPTFKERTVRLDFMTKIGLLFPAYCYIVPILPSRSFGAGAIVTAFEMAGTSKTFEKKIKNIVLGLESAPKSKPRIKNILRPYDIEIIRSIGEHLRKHLQDRTPSLGDLESKFRINGFKLKNGFKELYGMTILQYLKEERLKKAHVLVEHTNYTFKDIAKMVGFRSATHFSREFNARFGYRPRALRNATGE